MVLGNCCWMRCMLSEVPLTFAMMIAAYPKALKSVFAGALVFADARRNCLNADALALAGLFQSTSKSIHLTLGSGRSGMSL